MAKRLNKKMVAGLTTAGMLLTTAAGVLMITYLPEKDPEPFVKYAEQLIVKGNLVDASKYYQKAAQRARDEGIYTEESYNYLIRAGELSLVSGDANTALGCWNRVTRNNPDHEKAQEKIVEFYLERSMLFGGGTWSQLQTEAEKLCSMTEKKGTKNYVGLHALGRALIEQRALNEKYVEDGIEFLSDAVDGDKSNPEYANSLAQHYFREEQFDKAEDIYNTLLSEENIPKDPESAATAYRYRGRYHLSKRLNDERILQQQQERRAHPNDLAAIRKQIAEEDQKAIQDIEKAIERNPDDVDSLVSMGKYWQLKQSSATDAQEKQSETRKYQENAKQYYEKAIQSDPDHYSAYLELAQLYLEMEDLESAIKVLDARIDRGIKRDHYLGWRHGQYMAMVRNAAFRVNLYKISLLREDTKISDQEREKVIEATKNKLRELHLKTVAEVAGGEEDPNALYMKGRLLELDGKVYEAITELVKAENMLPHINLDIKRSLASLYQLSNSPGNAEEALNILIDANQEDYAAMAMLATIQAQTNRPEEAIETANRALALEPNFRPALLAKVEAYRRQKNYEGLKQIQEQISQLDKTEDSVGNKLAQAMVMIAQAANVTPPDPKLQSQAEKLLHEVLEIEPHNTMALQYIIPLLEKKEDGLKDINTLLTRANDALEKTKERITATAPEGMDKKTYRNTANAIKMLEIYLDKEIDEETKVKRVEEMIKQGEDPYQKATGLYALYTRVNRSDDAFKQLKIIHQHKPDDPQILNTLFRYALVKKDWDTAEKCAQKAIDMGLARAGGHFYRGRIWMSRTDLENNFTRAENELRAGVNNFPSYAEGRVWLGETLLNLGKHDEAADQFHQARKIDPGNGLAVVGLAHVASLQGNRQQMDQYLDLCARLAPNHPWVRKQFLARQEKRDPKAGIQYRENLRKANPSDMENLMGLANLYFIDKQFDKAKEIIQECLQKEPENLGALQQYANFMREKEPPQPKEAEKRIRETIQKFDSQKSEEKATAQLILASHFETVAQQEKNIQDQSVQEKIDAAFEAASGISDTPSIQIQIGQYYSRNKRPEKAAQWFQKALESSIKNKKEQIEKRAHSMLIDSMIQKADATTFDVIQKEIDKYKEKYPEEAFSLLLEGEYSLAKGQDSAAIELYTQYITRNTKRPIGFYRRGNAHFRRSQFDLAIEDLRQVKRLNPSFYNHQPRVLLIQALEKTRKIEEIITEMQELINENFNTLDMVRRLYEIYLQHGRFNSAQSLIKSQLQNDPDNPILYFYLANIADAQKQETQTIEHATTAVEKSKYRPEMALFLINTYLKYGRNAEAVKFAAKAAENTNQNPEIVHTLLGMYLRNNQFDTVLKYVSETLKPDQLTYVTHIQAGSALLGKKDIPKAIDAYIRAFNSDDLHIHMFLSTIRQDARVRAQTDTLFDAVNKRMQINPDERTLKFIATVLCKLTNDRDQFIKLTKELIEATPADNPKNTEIKIYLMRDMLAELYNAQNKYSESRKLYDEILKISPDEPLSMNNLAYMLAEKLNDPKSALPHAQRAIELMPNAPNILDTLGWIYVLLENYEDGIITLRKAIHVAPQIPALHYHLAEAFYRRSQAPAATAEHKNLEPAKNECNAAHSLIMNAGQDISNILEQVVALGEKLGLKLEKTIPQSQLPTEGPR
ncbi:MAG: tetratricopeptide repeat protein [Planctomycetota bacterium]|jgi:tetratricopeptide (TPR) repeat protein